MLFFSNSKLNKIFFLNRILFCRDIFTSWRSYRFTFFFFFVSFVFGNFLPFISIFHVLLQIHAWIFCISTLKYIPGFLTGFFYPDSGFFPRSFLDFKILQFLLFVILHCWKMILCFLFLGFFRFFPVFSPGFFLIF